jgi:hypothetical protein
MNSPLLRFYTSDILLIIFGESIMTTRAFDVCLLVERFDAAAPPLVVVVSDVLNVLPDVVLYRVFLWVLGHMSSVSFVRPQHVNDGNTRLLWVVERNFS